MSTGDLNDVIDMEQEEPAERIFDGKSLHDLLCVQGARTLVAGTVCACNNFFNEGI